MAKKKVRRVKKTKKKGTEVSETAVASETKSATKTTTTRSPTKNKRSKQQATAEDFQHEYAYVLKDLRLVFILAGFMFALLIALNLILQ